MHGQNHNKSVLY